MRDGPDQPDHDDALGHIACRSRMRVHAQRADRLFKRLKAARLDNSHEHELRRLIVVDLLIIDDFALHSLDPSATSDFYEIAVERHLSGATLLTSNREPIEWLTHHQDHHEEGSLMMIALLSLIITALRPNTTATRSHPRGGTPVPSMWRATVAGHRQ